MPKDERIDALVRNATAALAPLDVVLRGNDSDVIVDLARDGVVIWPDYASGPDRVLATLAAEQRYLAEQVGAGTVPGTTYLDKAREMLRRALAQ